MLCRTQVFTSCITVIILLSMSQNVTAQTKKMVNIVVDDNRTTWQIKAGTNIHTRLFVELGFVDFGDVSAAYSTVTATPDIFFSLTQTIRPTSFTASHRNLALLDVVSQVG